MFRAFMCPLSGENCCICITLVFVSLYGWRLVCWLDFQSNQQTRRHPFRVTNTSVVQIQQFSPDDGHMNARNVWRREINKYIKHNCAPSWIYLRGLYNYARPTKRKIPCTYLHLFVLTFYLMLCLFVAYTVTGLDRLGKWNPITYSSISPDLRSGNFLWSVNFTSTVFVCPGQVASLDTRVILNTGSLQLLRQWRHIYCNLPLARYITCHESGDRANLVT
jgi:hypothetical protein